jgi:hypothetical protein
MLVSTFELLYKPITPNPGQVPGSDRLVLQGYFLTIANTSNRSLTFRLRFNATTPSLNLADTVTITDDGIPDATGDENKIRNLIPTADPNQFTLDVTILPRDTALVILQPDIISLNLTPTIEFRGFVEIEITTRTFVADQTFDVLLTPEHRGTFLPKDFSSSTNNARKDFDQLTEALPTATGSSLFRIPGRFGLVPGNIKAIIDSPIAIPFPLPPQLEPPNLEQPPTPPAPRPGAGEQDLRVAVANLQDGMRLMARAIDSISSEIAAADTIVTPEP